MIRTFTLSYYFAKEFFRTVLNISAVFFCLGLIINLFEEINFFKDYDVGIFLPIILSFFYVPSLFYNMFPFVILLSGIWFFLTIKRSDEVTALKISGLSNFSIIIVPSMVSIILGIFFITAINPITSVLVKKYEKTKGSFEKDQDYLAAITINGIWIKEKKNIIRAAKLDNDQFIEVSIYEFDDENNFLRRLEAKSANINLKNWTLNDVKVIDMNGKTIAENLTNISYMSMYDINQIKTLYSNLDTVSFWSIKNEIELLENRGYSTNEMRSKLHQSIAFPFFLLGMILLSGVISLGFYLKDNNWNYIFVSIISSVVIFYFNRFSAALGKTDKLPIEISVWMPIAIILLISSVGLIHANQK
jgi:lipopolysaccharide export system permease protein